MRKRPQFFEDLDRELRGEEVSAAPEPAEESGGVQVQVITRQFHNPQAAENLREAQMAYMRDLMAAQSGIEQRTATSAMIEAQMQARRFDVFASSLMTPSPWDVFSQKGR